MLQSTLAFIEKTYEPSVRERMLADVSPRVRDVLANLNTVAWYPVPDVAELFRVIAEHHQRTDGKLRESLENVGRSICEAATTTFLKLILKILTPSLFASKMSGFWERDHRCGTLKAVDFDPKSARMKVVLSGVKGYDYIGPVAPGFVLQALELLGLHDVRVSYDWTVEDLSPDEIEYLFTWRS